MRFLATWTVCPKHSRRLLAESEDVPRLLRREPMLQMSRRSYRRRVYPSPCKNNDNGARLTFLSVQRPFHMNRRVHRRLGSRVIAPVNWGKSKHFAKKT